MVEKSQTDWRIRLLLAKWRKIQGFHTFRKGIDLHIFILIRAYNSLLQQRWK